MSQRPSDIPRLLRQPTEMFENDSEELMATSGAMEVGEASADALLSSRLLSYVNHPGSSEERDDSVIFSAQASELWKGKLGRLTSRETQMFQEHGKSSLTQYTQQVHLICKTSTEESKGGKIAKLFRPWFRTANLYAPIAQTMIQADPTSSALVLGGITCILAISERFDEFSEVVDVLADMGDRSDLLMSYIDQVYRNNDFVQCAIVEIFGDILDFSREALALFTKEDGQRRSSGKRFRLALTTSFRIHFGSILAKYQRDLVTFEERAKLCDRREEYGFRSLEAQSLSTIMVQVSHVRDDLMSMQQHASTLAGGFHLAALRMNQMRSIEMARAKQEAAIFQQTLRNRIIAWMEAASVKFHEDQNEMTMKRLPETGRWIVKELAAYAQWKAASESQFLWIKGGRGSGKSFLASVFISDLKELCESMTNLQSVAIERRAYAFVYCSSLEVDKVDCAKLLGSIVAQLSHQLPKPEIDTNLRALYTRHHEGSRNPTIHEIKEALDFLLGCFGETYLVIDGLDELRVLREPTLFSDMATYLYQLAQPRDDTSIVKLAVFSRPDFGAINDAFGDCKQIPIDEGGNDQDIEKYIDVKLMAIGGLFKKNLDLLPEIKLELLQRAEGMFLWVDLVTNSLRGVRTVNVLRQKIQEIPPGLDYQYTSSLETIIKDENVRDMSLNVLLWVTNAKRPLKRAELAEALAIRPNTSTIDTGDKLDYDINFGGDCENLVKFNTMTNSYQLVHSSLRDYLKLTTGRTDVPKAYSDLQQNAHRILGELCLTYLNFDDFKSLPRFGSREYEQLLERYPFLRYAAVYWGKHVVGSESDSLYPLVKTFVMQPERRQLSMMMFDEAEDDSANLYPSSSTPLHILAMHDVVEVATSLEGLHNDLTKIDGNLSTPLDYALKYSCRRMCNFLLDNLKVIRYPGIRLMHRRHGLLSAAAKGWCEVVEAFIDLGSDVNDKTTSEQVTAVHFAAMYGSEEALLLLLEKGADKNALDIDGSTPLLRACEVNQHACATSLISAGANVHLPGWNNTTPLHHAAKNGDLKLIKTLLEKDVDYEAKCAESWGYRTPLHLAAEEGHHGVLAALIDAGADVNVSGLGGFTALHYTCMAGDAECLHTLLRADAKLEIKTDDGHNPLHLAASRNHIAILERLFDQRPDACAKLIDQTDSIGQVPLHYATEDGHLEAVRFLLGKGAEIRVKAGEQSPFLLAIEKGHANIAELYLKQDPDIALSIGYASMPVLHYLAHYGADHPNMNSLVVQVLTKDTNPEAASTSGRRAIHHAMAAGNIAFADILIQHVPILELSAKTKATDTPLHLAASSGITKSVVWLLSHKKSLANVRNGSKNLPMHLAAWNGHLETLQCLLTPDDVDEPGFKERTALFGASVRGHKDLVTYLLDKKADPNLADEFGETPLMVSIQKKHVVIANILLDNGADAKALNKNKNSALHQACEAGDEALVQRLLTLGCEPLHRNGWGKTPFLEALTCTNPEIIAVLIDKGFNGWGISDNTGMSSLHALAAFGDIEQFQRYRHNFTADDYTAVDIVGRNAIWYAAANGHSDMVETLSKLGVPIQGRLDSRRGTLHDAAEEGYLSTVKSLLEIRKDRVGVDERRGLDESTALHHAVASGRRRTALLLLSAGANPSLRNGYGLTCFDYAIRHPAAWKGTPLETLSHVPTSLAQKLPSIKATALRAIAEILAISDLSVSGNEYTRVDNVRTLLFALQEIKTPEAGERAAICRLELTSPFEFAYFDLTYNCNICGNLQLTGYRYACPAGHAAVCATCYIDFEKGGIGPCTAPKSLRELERLQAQIEPVRRAVAGIIDWGWELTLRACTHLIMSKDFLAEKHNECKEWSKQYNADKRFADSKLTGARFLDWLQRASKTYAVMYGTSDFENATSATNGTTGGGDRPPWSRPSNNVNSVHEENAEMSNLAPDPEVLDRDLRALFREHRPDQDLRVFACDGHEFEEWLKMESATEEQKDCIGANGRIKSEWFQELKTWLEKLSINSGDDPSPPATLTSQPTNHIERPKTANQNDAESNKKFYDLSHIRRVLMMDYKDYIRGLCNAADEAAEAQRTIALTSEPAEISQEFEDDEEPHPKRSATLPSPKTRFAQLTLQSRGGLKRAGTLPVFRHNLKDTNVSLSEMVESVPSAALPSALLTLLLHQISWQVAQAIVLGKEELPKLEWTFGKD